VVGAYSSSLKTVTDNLLATGGTVASRADGLTRSVADISKRREALNLRLTNIEKQYRAQFTALDAAVSSMQSTSTYLTQQLAGIANITNYNSNNN
jgi:flagellar hook-associated protein 2